MKSAAEPFLKELNAIRIYLQAVQASLKDGSMPDMSGLDQRIADLCKNLHEAGREVQAQCLPELSVLLKDLDVCEKDLRAWHAAAMQAEDKT